jgi:hypothetical protein
LVSIFNFARASYILEIFFSSDGGQRNCTSFGSNLWLESRVEFEFASFCLDLFVHQRHFFNSCFFNSCLPGCGPAVLNTLCEPTLSSRLLLSNQTLHPVRVQHHRGSLQSTNGRLLSRPVDQADNVTSLDSPGESPRTFRRRPTFACLWHILVSQQLTFVPSPARGAHGHV